MGVQTGPREGHVLKFVPPDFGLQTAVICRGKVFAACDRTRLRGRRDYAILLLLARLVLRAGEVLRLMLDDIDWEHGQILVRFKKGPGHPRMPLPPD